MVTSNKAIGNIWAMESAPTAYGAKCKKTAQLLAKKLGNVVFYVEILVCKHCYHLKDGLMLLSQRFWFANAVELLVHL